MVWLLYPILNKKLKLMTFLYCIRGFFKNKLIGISIRLGQIIPLPIQLFQCSIYCVCVGLFIWLVTMLKMTQENKNKKFDFFGETNT